MHCLLERQADMELYRLASVHAFLLFTTVLFDANTSAELLQVFFGIPMGRILPFRAWHAVFRLHSNTNHICSRLCVHTTDDGIGFLGKFGLRARNGGSTKSFVLVQLWPLVQTDSLHKRDQAIS